MNTYTPQQIYTSHITHNDDIKTIAEQLAKNTHENWALQRMKEGWSYGPKWDDSLKQTPVMVPYEELSESEKEYDRITSLETLKTIIALGYEIRLPLRVQSTVDTPNSIRQREYTTN